MDIVVAHAHLLNSRMRSFGFWPRVCMERTRLRIGADRFAIGIVLQSWLSYSSSSRAIGGTATELTSGRIMFWT